jgi:hypothetical protein
MLWLEVFGDLTCTVSGGSAPLGGTPISTGKSVRLSSSARAVLGFLILHPGRQPRRHVRSATEIHSDDTFRSTLKRLRDGPLSAVFAGDEGHLELRVDHESSSWHKFRKECLSAEPVDWLNAWKRSEQTLLDGLDLGGGGWLGEARAEVAAARAGLCKRALSSNDQSRQEAQLWLARWTGLEPLSEEPILSGAAVLQRLGEPALGVGAIDAFVRRLHDAGAAPSQELLELLEHLQTGQGGRPIPLRRSLVLPARLEIQPKAPLEREPQLDHLKSKLVLALQERQVVLLEGEAGMGKTALMAWACVQWGPASSSRPGPQSSATGYPAVLWGDFGQEKYYGAFFAALDDYIDGLPDDELAYQFGPYAEVLAAELPVLGDRLGLAPLAQGGDRGGRRQRLFRALAETIRLIARAGPTVLVLDDLHKAGKDDRQLLSHLLRATDLRPMLILLAYRPDSHLSDWLRNVAEEISPLSTLSVGPLSIEGVERMISESLGSSPQPTVDRVADQTRCIPFFIERAIEGLGPTAELDPAIPEETPSFDIEALDGDSLDVLACAALLGVETDQRLLTQALSPAHPVRHAVSWGLSAGILVHDEHQMLRFTHDLFREQLLARAEDRLAALAGPLAEAMESDPDADAALSASLHELSGNRAAALADRRRAARQAQGALAHADAVGHLLTALTLVDGEDERLPTLMELGLAQWQSGMIQGSAQTYYDAARLAEKLDRPDDLAEAALGAVGRLGFQGVTADSRLVDLLSTALEALPEADSSVRARVLGCLAQALTFSGKQQHAVAELSEEAERMARRIDDDELTLDLLCRTCWATWTPQNLLRRRARADEMVQLADAVGNGPLSFEAHIQHLAIALETGHRARALADVEICERLAAGLNLAYYTALACYIRGMVELLDGPRADVGERSTWEGLEVGQREQNQGILQLFGAQLLYVRLLQGRSAELLAASQSLTEYYKPIAAWRAGLALIYTETNNPDQAAEAVSALAAKRFSAIPRDMFFIVCMDHLARASVALYPNYGIDDALMEAIYTELAPYADRQVLAGVAAAVHGSVHLPLGLLAAAQGESHLAAQHFRGAASAAAAMGCRPASIEARVHLLLVELADPGADIRPLDLMLDELALLVQESAELGIVRSAEALGVALLHAQRRATADGRDELAAKADALRGAVELLLAEATPVVPSSSTMRRVLGRTVARHIAPRLGPRLDRYDDLTLEKHFDQAQEKVMRGMALLYQPDMGCGFVGQVGFRFPRTQGSKDVYEWCFEIDLTRARATRGPPEDAKAIVTAPVRQFAELLTRRLNGVQGWVEGRIKVDGDPTVAARLVEMFGGEQALIDLDPGDTTGS